MSWVDVHGHMCVCGVSPLPVPWRCLAQGVEKMLNVPTAAAALSAGCSLVKPSWRPECLRQAPPLEGSYGKRKCIARSVAVGTGSSHGVNAACSILAALPPAGTFLCIALMPVSRVAWSNATSLGPSPLLCTGLVTVQGGEER